MTRMDPTALEAASDDQLLAMVSALFDIRSELQRRGYKMQFVAPAYDRPIFFKPQPTNGHAR